MYVLQADQTKQLWGSVWFLARKETSLCICMYVYVLRMQTKLRINRQIF